MNDNHQPPLPEDTLRLIIRDEVTHLIANHQATCPFTTNNYRTRVRALELSLIKLTALMIGSGLISAGSAVGLMKIIP